MAYYYKIRADWEQVFSFIKTTYEKPDPKIGFKVQPGTGEVDIYVGVSHPGAIQILDKFCPVVVKEVPKNVLQSQEWLTIDEGNYFQYPAL